MEKEFGFFPPAIWRLIFDYVEEHQTDFDMMQECGQGNAFVVARLNGIGYQRLDLLKMISPDEFKGFIHAEEGWQQIKDNFYPNAENLNPEEEARKARIRRNVAVAIDAFSQYSDFVTVKENEKTFSFPDSMLPKLEYYKKILRQMFCEDVENRLAIEKALLILLDKKIREMLSIGLRQAP